MKSFIEFLYLKAVVGVMRVDTVSLLATGLSRILSEIEVCFIFDQLVMKTLVRFSLAHEVNMTAEE